MENETPDVLQNFSNEFPIEDASVLQRFLNYLIDFFIYYILLVMVLLVVIASTGEEEAIQARLANAGIKEQLILLFFYGLYMSVIEGLFKGRSIGKFITGTAATYHDGHRISWETAFKRGLLRLVPFEQFSIAFGRPWHDVWTQTRVIRIRKM